MESTVTDYLLVYSLDTSGLEMRFELFVSEDGITYQQVSSPLSVDSRTFFENDNARIDISLLGDVNFVQFWSFAGDMVCGSIFGAPKKPIPTNTGGTAPPSS